MKYLGERCQSLSITHRATRAVLPAEAGNRVEFTDGYRAESLTPSHVGGGTRLR